MRQRLQQKSMCRSMAERASSGSPRPMAEQIATCWEPMTIRLSFFLFRGNELAGADRQVVKGALEGLEHVDEILVLCGQHQLVVELQVDLGPLGGGGGGIQILRKVLPGGLELVCQLLEPGQVNQGPLLCAEEGRLSFDGPPGHEQVLQGLAAEVKDEVAAVFAVAAADGGHQAVFLQPLHRPGHRGRC